MVPSRDGRSGSQSRSLHPSPARPSPSLPRPPLPMSVSRPHRRPPLPRAHLLCLGGAAAGLLYRLHRRIRRPPHVLKRRFAPAPALGVSRRTAAPCPRSPADAAAPVGTRKARPHLTTLAGAPGPSCTCTRTCTAARPARPTRNRGGRPRGGQTLTGQWSARAVRRAGVRCRGSCSAGRAGGRLPR